MSLGWKFYVKYIIAFIPISIMSIPMIFMPKHKAFKYSLKNRLTQKILEWIMK